jgi:hypothetical protein
MCETVSVTLRQEHRLRVFENRVLRRIFGPKREGMAGDWRRLHNEELLNFHDSLIIIIIIMVIKLGRMRLAVTVARTGELRNA